MIIKHRPSIEFPDPREIKDSNVITFVSDLARCLMQAFKNLYDDIVNLEKIERITSFTAGTGPTAELASRGKIVLLQGTGGAADGLYICVDTGGGGYAFKPITVTI